jgi:hypothetical protein
MHIRKGTELMFYNCTFYLTLTELYIKVATRGLFIEICMCQNTSSFIKSLKTVLEL